MIRNHKVLWWIFFEVLKDHCISIEESNIDKEMHNIQLNRTGSSMNHEASNTIRSELNIHFLEIPVFETNEAKSQKMQ